MRYYGCIIIYLSLFYFRAIGGTTTGGILAIKTTFLKDINGFSNAYYGWGGEDDDLYTRYVCRDDVMMLQANVPVFNDTKEVHL